MPCNSAKAKYRLEINKDFLNAEESDFRIESIFLMGVIVDEQE